MLNRCLNLVGMLLLSLPLSGWAEISVPPFVAKYTVYGKGLPLGEGSISLEHTGANQYRMSSHVWPTGLAAMMVSDRIDEYAEGELRDGQVLPKSYQQQRSGGKQSHDERANFNWAQQQVETRFDGQVAQLALKPGLVDPLSLHLLVISDLSRNQLPAEYSFVDEREIKTYQIQKQGEETLKTPLGNLLTVRIKQQKPDSTRITTLWFAPQLNYLPVQIVQEKKGKEILRMLIQDVRINQQP